MVVVGSPARRRREEETPPVVVEEEREGGEGRARFEGRSSSSSSVVDAKSRCVPPLRPLIADEFAFPLPFCSFPGGGGGGGTYLLTDRRAAGEAVAAAGTTTFLTILVVVVVVVLMIAGLCWVLLTGEEEEGAAAVVVRGGAAAAAVGGAAWPGIALRLPENILIGLLAVCRVGIGRRRRRVHCTGVVVAGAGGRGGLGGVETARISIPKTRRSKHRHKTEWRESEFKFTLFVRSLPSLARSKEESRGGKWPVRSSVPTEASP